jgi:DNA-binding response OmpR family regulator
MAGTILLVEDEESIASLLRAYLERDGYRVCWERSGAGALAALERGPVEVVILDVGLPDVDGFEVCRRMRAASRVPILMVTARDEEVDRVAGLEIGADDYITKPFSPREVVARVRAVLRRMQPEPQDEAAELSLGDVVIRPSAREVLADGDQVELTAKEFDLLVFLIENRGVVLTRELLLDRVWGFDFPGGTRTVDVHVAQLRRKLDRPDLIKTIRGVGYKALRQ